MTNQIDIYRFHLSQMLKLTRAAFEGHDVWKAAHDCLYPPITASEIEKWWKITDEDEGEKS
jgi:arsenate reductase-like glutaredoxin family protein